MDKIQVTPRAVVSILEHPLVLKYFKCDCLGGPVGHSAYSQCEDVMALRVLKAMSERLEKGDKVLVVSGNGVVDEEIWNDPRPLSLASLWHASVLRLPSQFQSRKEPGCHPEPCGCILPCNEECLCPRHQHNLIIKTFNQGNKGSNRTPPPNEKCDGSFCRKCGPIKCQCPENCDHKGIGLPGCSICDPLVKKSPEFPPEECKGGNIFFSNKGVFCSECKYPLVHAQKSRGEA